MQSRRILVLDLVRFFAALMVMIFHLAYYSWAAEYHKVVSGPDFPELAPVTWFGFVGVQIFFVISGFVITYSASEATPFSFLQSRIVRLYPGAWICGTLTAATLAILELYKPAELVGRYISTITLQPLGPWVDEIYWTLGVEIMFYSVIFCVLLFKKAKYLPVVLVTIGAASSINWFLRAINKIMPDVFSLTPFIKDWDYHLFDLLLLTHGCFFAIGGLLWHLYVRRGSSLWWGAVGGLALTGIVQISAFTSIKVASGAALLVPDAAWLIALAVIIASVHFNETAWRLLGPHSRLIGVIGLTTYPLYLLHKEIGTAIVQELWHVGVSRWTALGTGILFVLVLSFAVTLFFEPKLQAWVRAVLATWAARAPRLVLPQNEVGTSGS